MRGTSADAWSFATALLGIFTADTTVGKILTVVVAIATALAVYQVPNAPTAAVNRPARVTPQGDATN